MARRPEQDGLLLQERAGFEVLQDALDDAAGLVGLIADGDQLRLCARRMRRLRWQVRLVPTPEVTIRIRSAHELDRAGLQAMTTETHAESR